jgi:DNA-binding beta-propeller fold protein YncE
MKKLLQTLLIFSLFFIGTQTFAQSTILGTTGDSPFSVTIDTAGNIYTANSGSNNVSKITPAGVSTVLGTTGTSPRGIAIDSAGNVYTANNTSYNVSKITPAGVSTILGTTGTYPMGIAHDNDGNIYTANSGSNNVSKITPAGVSTILGTTGASPYAVAIDSAGNVYTSNYFSNNVSKITPAGVSTVLGTTGTSPRGIAIDSAGNIYTANSGSNNVSKITPAGVSTILGTTGTDPIGIAIDSAENIYTANSGSNNVSKITPAGVSTILGTTGTYPIGIAHDNDGNIYTANFSSSNVSKIIPPDITNPTIGSLTPADNATDIATADNLVITFTEIVDAESGSITLYKTSDDSVVEVFDVASDISGSGTNTITINPTNDFEEQISYYIRIDATAFDDETGNSFAGVLDTTTWRFTTVTLPSVLSTTPTNGSINVSNDPTFVITFSEAIDPISFSSSVSPCGFGADGLSCATPSTVWSSGDTVATVTNGNGVFQYDTEYTLSINQALSATTGEDLEALYELTFTIEPDPAAPSSTRSSSSPQSRAKARQVFSEYYAQKNVTETTTSEAQENNTCSANQTLTQNLRAPSRNGVFNSYTQGIVTEANILQGHLNRLGFNSGLEDGIIGRLTDGAIKRMQTFLGSIPDGYVGPITRGLLNESCGEGGLEN